MDRWIRVRASLSVRRRTSRALLLVDDDGVRACYGLRTHAIDWPDVDRVVWRDDWVVRSAPAARVTVVARSGTRVPLRDTISADGSRAVRRAVVAEARRRGIRVVYDDRQRRKAHQKPATGTELRE